MRNHSFHTRAAPERLMADGRRVPRIERGSTWCFDCDGTILDSSTQFVAAHTRAVVALGGTPVSGYWCRRRAGESEEALCAAAGLLEVARYQLLRQEVFDTWPSTPSPHPASAPLIRRLWSTGANVVVISHRSSLDSLVNDLLRAGVLSYLSSVFATKVRQGPGDAPRHARMAKAEVLEGFAAGGPTVMVGDSEADIAAAQSAGIASIGIASGCSSMARLSAGGATWVVPSLMELYAILFDQDHASSSPRVRTRYVQGEDECYSQRFAVCAD